jgi:hypothetical protein
MHSSCACSSRAVLSSPHLPDAGAACSGRTACRRLRAIALLTIALLLRSVGVRATRVAAIAPVASRRSPVASVRRCSAVGGAVSWL